MGNSFMFTLSGISHLPQRTMPKNPSLSTSSHLLQASVASLLWLALLPSAHCADGDNIYQRKGMDGAIALSNIPEGDDYQLLIAAPFAKAAMGFVPNYASIANVGTLTSRILRFKDMVGSVAQSKQVDPRLIHALISVESGYNPQAISPKGAVGLMQLMPATARRYGVTDIRDPRQNIEGGVRYFSDLLRMFNQDVSLALAAYNAGENAVLKYGRQIPPYQETKAYVPKVLALYEKLNSLKI
jgi:soluble lytic murein transglycosylase-like protein